MDLWKKIKAFFGGSRPEKGDLEADIEVVRADEDDGIDVEVVEMADDQTCGTDEDEDIDVEIIETDEQPAEVSADGITRKAHNQGQTLRPSEPVCSAEDQSRMTDEYVQWLKKQQRQEEAADRQVNG